VGVAWLEWVFEQSCARGSALLALLTLADRANDDGVCWPGIADIARRTKLSERYVKRVIRELEELGEIRTVPGGRGPRDTSRYIILAGRDPDAIEKLAAQIRVTKRTPLADRPRARNGCERRKGDTPGGKRVTPEAPEGDTPGATRVTVRPPEPSENRQREPSEEPSERCFEQNIVKRAGAVVGNNGAVVLEIQRILSEHGCDDAGFRKAVSRRAPLPVVKRIASEYESQHRKIRNAGGWWRDTLRRNAVDV
jgi:hypothetical protein